MDVALHDTYYVVAENVAVFSLPLLALPNSKTYNLANIDKDTIINEYRNKRGVYLWTHNESGKQYVGSSKNLGNRLTEYFRPSYLTTQSGRGNIISRALIAHGHSAFTLSVQVLGPTDETQVYSSSNLPDFVTLEQAYLSSYILAYNVNRIASSAAYRPSEGPVNVGQENPSFGKLSVDAFAWGRTHSQVLKDLWSDTRGKYTFWLYSLDTSILIQEFKSASALSKYFDGVSKRFGTDIHKNLKALGMPALVYGKHIISVLQLTTAQLQEMLGDLPVKEVVEPREKSPTGKTVYGYNPSTDTYVEWSSLEKCTHALTGNRFENKETVNLRIYKHILFHNHYLQTVPFSSKKK